MPLMFNLHENGGIGDAAALYMADDFYVPRKFLNRFPGAVAFVLIKTEPRILHPVYYNVERNFFLLDSKTDSRRNIVGLTYGPDMKNVLDYLSIYERRIALEPTYFGQWVAGALRARLPRRTNVARSLEWGRDATDGRVV